MDQSSHRVPVTRPAASSACASSTVSDFRMALGLCDKLDHGEHSRRGNKTSGHRWALLSATTSQLFPASRTCGFVRMQILSVDPLRD